MLLFEPFDFHARSRGGYALARSDGTNYTYAEGRERSIRIASALLELGLRPGDRIVTIMSNSIDALLVVYAAARTGIVCAPLNLRLAPREWMGMIEDAGARVVIADADFARALEAAGGKPPVAICSRSAPAGWLALDDLVAEAVCHLPVAPIAAAAPVLQLYTSGTTGKPKGAMISHQSLISKLDFAQLRGVAGKLRQAIQELGGDFRRVPPRRGH